MVDSSTIKCIGRVRLHLTLGNKKRRMIFEVAKNIRVSILIGNDILRDFQVCINYKDLSIKASETDNSSSFSTTVPAYINDSNINAIFPLEIPLWTREDITLAPRTTTQISVVASLSNLCDGDLVGLVKEGPDLHSEFGVMIPRGICQLSADSGTTRILKNTYIYISNFNDNTLVIPRGSIVPTVETLDEREDLIIEGTGLSLLLNWKLHPQKRRFELVL